MIPRECCVRAGNLVVNLQPYVSFSLTREFFYDRHDDSEKAALASMCPPS